MLGDHDNPGFYPPMTWYLAKIMRLFNTPSNKITPPPPEADEDARLSFQFAEKLMHSNSTDDPTRPALETPEFEEWAAVAELLGLVPKKVIAIVRYLAVLDPSRRPTAAQALLSNE